MIQCGQEGWWSECAGAAERSEREVSDEEEAIPVEESGIFWSAMQGRTLNVE